MNIFIGKMKNQFHKIGRETQSLALNNLLVFKERSLTRQHVVRRPLIQKKKRQTKFLL